MQNYKKERGSSNGDILKALSVPLLQIDNPTLLQVESPTLMHSHDHCHGHSHGDSENSPSPMHLHVHSHGNGDVNFNALCNLVSQLVGITLDLSLFITNSMDPAPEEKTVLNTFTPLAVALAVPPAVFAATGSTYCHWILNKNHQPNYEDCVSPRYDQDSSFTIGQYILLTGDYLSHITEVLTPLIMFVQFKASAKEWRIAGDALAIIASFWYAKAAAHTCKENLRLYYLRGSAAGHSHGVHTVANAVIGFPSYIFGLTLDIGSLIDNCLNADNAKRYILGHFTPWGFGIGLGTSVLGAAGATYCHYVLNKNYEHGKHADDEICDEESTTIAELSSSSALSWWQYLALLGDLLAHVNEVATPLIAAAELLTEDSTTKLFVGALSLAAGLWSAKPDVLTCWDNLLTYNRRAVVDRKEAISLRPF